MTSDFKVDETARMFEEIRPKLQDDMGAIEEEMKILGYKVLTLHPRHVSLYQSKGRLGFLVTLPNEKAKDVMNLLGSGLRYTVDMEFGLHKQLAVFVITLKITGAKWAILYPVYYHTGAEWLIKDQGKRGLYTFFSTQRGDIVREVNMGNYQLYLYTRYQRKV